MCHPWRLQDDSNSFLTRLAGEILAVSLAREKLKLNSGFQVESFAECGVCAILSHPDQFIVLI